MPPIDPAVRAELQRLDPDRELCPRCRCCEMAREECDRCGGDGLDGHDCGEDCCCLHPEDNVPCDQCGGKGGWTICLGCCGADGKHGR